MTLSRQTVITTWPQYECGAESTSTSLEAALGHVRCSPLTPIYALVSHLFPEVSPGIFASPAIVAPGLDNSYAQSYSIGGINTLRAYTLTVVPA
jgi:hypothetical protein